MNPTAPARPTIKDIARVCGVSEATVSYVINGKRVLKADTRERVVRAMREMNYHPSAVARGLASKKVHTFGILSGAVDSIEFLTNSYASGLLRGVMVRARQESFNVTLFTAPWESSEVSAPPLRDGRTDGILVIAPQVDTDIVEGLKGLGMPLVAISAHPGAGLTNVDVDNAAGIRLAVQHLVALGHSRIAFLTGNEDMASFAPRRDAYLQALREAGIAPVEEYVLVSHYDGSLAAEQTRKLLALPQPPTAILAGNDTIAVEVMEAARNLGVSIPEQLSVIGFDDAPAALLVTPSLTTIRQPLREIGEAAAQFLIEAMREPIAAETKTILLPPELVVRGTTGPAPL